MKQKKLVFVFNKSLIAHLRGHNERFLKEMGPLNILRTTEFHFYIQ